MNLRLWFTAQEARSLLWRTAGVVVAALTGLIAIKVFLARQPEHASGLIAMVGLLSFLPLLQLGLGRPVYSLLRSRLVGGMLLGELLRSALSLFGALALMGVAVHAAVGAWVVAHQSSSAGWVDVAVLAAGLAANGTAVFQRDVCYALSREDHYERAELVRRMVVLGSYGALWAGVAMSVVGAVLFVSGVATQAVTARGAFAAHPLQSKEGRPFEGLAPDAMRYLAFSFNELLLYNLPLLIFSLQSAGPELIYFGVWARLFQLLVLPMRMLVDARVNRQTTAWFIGDKAEVERELKRSLALAIVSVCVAIALLTMVVSSLLGWLGLSALDADRWLLVGLAAWAVGNAVQHVYGSFTLSWGGGFAFALKVSLGASLATGAVFMTARAAGLAVGPSLAAMGLVYSISAFAYLVHVRCLVPSPFKVTR